MAIEISEMVIERTREIEEAFKVGGGPAVIRKYNANTGHSFTVADGTVSIGKLTLHRARVLRALLNEAIKAAEDQDAQGLVRT